MSHGELERFRVYRVYRVYRVLGLGLRALGFGFWG